MRTDAVGVLGQSLGGCTALADPSRVVLNPGVIWQRQAPGEVVERRDFRDPRVRVVVAVNPITHPIFSAASMADVAVPLLVRSQLSRQQLLELVQDPRITPSLDHAWMDHSLMDHSIPIGCHG